MERRESAMDKVYNSPQFKAFMKKLALMAGLVIMVGLLMKLFHMEGASPLLTAGCGTLAIVTFFLGRLFPCPYQNGRPIWTFAMTITGYALSVVILGLLFMMMHWPGGRQMMAIGAGALAICAIAWLFYLRKYKNHSDVQTFGDRNNQQ